MQKNFAAVTICCSSLKHLQIFDETSKDHSKAEKTKSENIPSIASSSQLHPALTALPSIRAPFADLTNDLSLASSSGKHYYAEYIKAVLFKLFSSCHTNKFWMWPPHTCIAKANTSATWTKHFISILSKRAIFGAHLSLFQGTLVRRRTQFGKHCIKATCRGAIEEIHCLIWIISISPAVSCLSVRFRKKAQLSHVT